LFIDFVHICVSISVLDKNMHPQNVYEDGTFML